jgi:diacylglycerol kinase (ATP)
VRQVLIAFNPKSGASSAERVTRGLRDALEGRGFPARILTSLEQLQAECAALYAANQLEAVISAGGDGTVCELANRLPSQVPLLIFPLGTENLLAKYWGIPADVDYLCNILMAGRIIEMDVGSANGKLFLVMLSCGFDAEVVHRMHAQRKGHIDRWTYAVPILKTIVSYRFPRMSIQHPSQPIDIETEVPWLFVFNVPRYAANLQFCPHADPTDGKLDVCTFRGSGALAGFYYLYQLWRGQHEKLSDFRHHQIRRLQIDPPLDSQGNTVEIPFQIDGDPGGSLPLQIEVLPARLRLLVPESTMMADPSTVLPPLVGPSYL